MQFKRIYTCPASAADGYVLQDIDLTKPLTSEDVSGYGASPLFVNFGKDIPAASFAACYQTMIETVQYLADALDTVTIMPQRFSMLRSAKAISDFLEKVDRANVEVLLAPGELLANSAEDEMFYALDGRIAGLYGSDIDLASMESVALGDGDVSWTTILSLFAEHCEGCPVYLPDHDRFDADCKFIEKLNDIAKRMLG